MLDLEELLNARRDTRHYTADRVPDAVIEKALKAGHMAPSVGLTDATRYFLIKDQGIKNQIKELFEESNVKALELLEGNSRKDIYASLKLEAIVDAPLGLVVCYDRSVLNTFTIGTIASNETIKLSAVCAIQNIWLSLTEQGYSMGWVSILNYYTFKKKLGLADEMEPLGYFCIGKPATDYEKQPMLQQLGWKEKSINPVCSTITALHTQQVQVHQNDLVIKENISGEIQKRIDQKTKPLGSLGMLEKLALQIGTVLGSLSPELVKPAIVVFAADHGISQHGISKYPMEVTRQMVNNFLEGGAAINVFCRQHAIDLRIVDAGVNYDFPSNTELLDCKIGKGTASFVHGPAMSLTEFNLCLEMGAAIVNTIALTGCNIMGFGEMGIGNTASASALMSVLCTLPVAECVGAGTGINEQQLARKTEILEKAIQNYTGTGTPESFMAYFGGFEIMQIAGAILEARRKNMLIMVDGFIVTTAFLCAWILNPDVMSNSIFCHESGEKGHKLLLNYLKAEPLLKLQMRLGEGTGCALAFPLIKSSVSFLNEMASFEDASVNSTV